MRFPVVFIIFCLCMNVGCTSQTDDSIISGLTDSQSFKGDASDACFDIQMNVWLEKFQQYQQTGADMFSADLKAREAALSAYRHCQNMRRGAPANDQARK
jgi:hypothetical protein